LRKKENLHAIRSRCRFPNRARDLPLRLRIRKERLDEERPRGLLAPFRSIEYFRWNVNIFEALSERFVDLAIPARRYQRRQGEDCAFRAFAESRMAGVKMQNAGAVNVASNRR